MSFQSNGPGWRSHIQPTYSASNHGGGSGSPGYMRPNTEEKEKVDEFSSLNETSEDIDVEIQNKNIFELILDLISGIFNSFLAFFGIKNEKPDEDSK